ncbi:MAG: YtxH domain-containing protein [Candidatus Kapabacteria bacterium]|nr:YtxH domain-containing protein [Candidatus Kapabacteria bacterium]MBX7155990.1 YtxH domain-containing protein [Bacteroidota bacterium]
MAERESNYAKGFIAGAIIGGAAGALAALLFAPKSGRELRQDLVEKSGELYDKAQQYMNNDQLGEELPPTSANEGRMKAERIVQTARDHAESLLSNAEQVLRDARIKAVNAKDAVQDNISRVRDAAKASVETFKNEINNEDY